MRIVDCPGRARARRHPAGRRTGSRPDRHGRRLRPRPLRAAARRSPPPLPGGPRDPHEGGSRQRRLPRLGRATAGPRTCAPRWRRACGGCASTGIDAVLAARALTETVPLEESVGALADLRDEGKIRHVGLSNVTLEQLRTAQAVVDIVCVQNEYNEEKARRRGRARGMSRRRASASCPGSRSAGRGRSPQCVSALAARPLSGAAADPGNVVARAPRGEHGGRSGMSPLRVVHVGVGLLLGPELGGADRRRTRLPPRRRRRRGRAGPRVGRAGARRPRVPRPRAGAARGRAPTSSCSPRRPRRTGRSPSWRSPRAVT